jgi:hypothetical protein
MVPAHGIPFGPAGPGADYRSPTTGTIAVVEVAAAVAAHDRAVERFPVGPAGRTQGPLLAVVVAGTVGRPALPVGG